MSHKPSPLPVEQMLQELLQSRKYQNLAVSEETLKDVVAQEARSHSSKRAALDAARRKLHNIVAPYLGDPDYTHAAALLDDAFQTQDQAIIRDTCAHIMRSHVSTRERLDLLDVLYTSIFSLTGMPDRILDLACGIHPLSLPWMGLPDSTQYFAYDILVDRVNFLNHFFTLQRMPPTAQLQDILVRPPEESGDIAFIFKEIHRFEQRQRGATLKLFDSLQVRYLVVSLPTQNMSGKIDFTQSYQRMFYKIVNQRPWQVDEIFYPGEMFFCIKKS